MPITGSDKALMQARSGIARAGATRSGFYTPNVVTVINGVNRSTAILAGSMSILLALNDEPDTASFTVKPTAGFTPLVGQEISIGLGTADNREFGGQVVGMTHARRRGNETPWLVVSCIDFQRLFDRRRITKEYSSESATAIAKDIVDKFTSGFTRLNIAPDLPTISFFPLTNETPSGALRRLAHHLGGGFYVDAFKDVHLFGSAGEPAGRAPTPPRTLTNSEPTLKVFRHDRDASQIRTRITVEGQRTKVPNLAVPAGATIFPVDDDLILDPATTPVSGGGITYTRLGRIGTQKFTYTFISELNLIPGISYPGTNAAAAASAGATELQIDSLPPDAPIWAKVGEQIIFALDFDTGPNRLIQIPSTGYGSIQTAIEIDTPITWLPFLGNIPASGAGSIVATQPAGSEVVNILQVDDTTAQSALAAIEGGDGIHEHLVSDHRLSVPGAQQRALAELTAFKAALTDASWETEDLNAKPGRPQVINLTVNDPLSTTVTITRVELRFPVPNYRPRRRCTASSVKLAETLDVITLEE